MAKTKMDCYLWKKKDTGEWLVVDEHRTHTKLSVSYRFTSDVNKATSALMIPTHIREQVNMVKAVRTVKTTIIKEFE